MAFQVTFCQWATKLNKLSPMVHAVLKSEYRPSKIGFKIIDLLLESIVVTKHHIHIIFIEGTQAWSINAIAVFSS